MCHSLEKLRLELLRASEQLRSFQQACRGKLSELSNGLDNWLSTGASFPTQVLEDLSCKQHQLQALLTDITARPELARLLEGRTLPGSLQDWEALLQQLVQECEAGAQQLRLQLDRARSLLEQTTRLSSQREIEVLEDLKFTAQELLKSLPATDPETFLADPLIPAITSLWKVLRGTAAGELDQPDLVADAVIVLETFGLRLLVSVCTGQVRTSPCTELAPHRPATDRLSVEEAVQRLSLGQKTVRVDQQPMAARVASNKVDQTPELVNLNKLMAISQRTREAAKVASQQYHQGAQAAVLQALADSLEVVVCVMRPMQDEIRIDDEIQHDLQVLATVQSACHHLQFGLEADRKAVFDFLKQLTSNHSVYLARHMRLEDRASLPDVYKLQPALNARLQKLKQLRDVKKILRKIGRTFELSEDNRDQAWDEVFRMIGELESLHIPISHRELRDILLPHLDTLPDVEPANPYVRRVIRNTIQFAAEREADTTVAPGGNFSAETRQVAKKLRGRTVVMIGGVPRPANAAKIKEAFGLGDLTWEPTEEHEPTSRFRSVVQAADIDMVLILIRWVGHAHAEDIRAYCREVNKPCVLIPSGYGVNRLANDILQQFSDFQTG
jgi:hypothetical protein